MALLPDVRHHEITRVPSGVLDPVACAVRTAGRSSAPSFPSTETARPAVRGGVGIQSVRRAPR